MYVKNNPRGKKFEIIPSYDGYLHIFYYGKKDYTMAILYEIYNFYLYESGNHKLNTNFEDFINSSKFFYFGNGMVKEEFKPNLLISLYKLSQ